MTWTAVLLMVVMAASAAGCSDLSTESTGPSVAVTDSLTTSSSTSVPDGDGPAASTSTDGVGATVPAVDADLDVSVVAVGLDVPWESRFLPDGRLLVTERSGRIVRLDVQTGVVETLGRIPVAQQGESGLMGLAVDPAFPSEPYVYVVYTYEARGADFGGLANRVSRLTLDEEGIGDEVILVDGIPGARIHDGSRVGFGPDGDLWVTTGDAGEAESARDPSSLAGKVLRMDRRGRPLPDNPSPASLVYSLGHRNPQGLAWRTGDALPFVTEHGPDQDDEINHLVPGGDFGWPAVRGMSGRGGFVDPVHTWTPTIALAGAVFYEADAIPGWMGSLLVVTLKESDLRRLVPADEGFTQVGEEYVLLDERFGRLRTIAVGPDGAVYVGTSNRDGRGSPAPSDDRILRITAR